MSKGLRQGGAILGMHRYAVVGLSMNRLVADVAFTHGRRQGKTDQRATATRAGGRLHTLLFNCMQRVCAPTPHCAMSKRP